MKYEKNWLGISLLFLGFLWFATTILIFWSESIEEKEWAKEQYTESTRLLSGLVELVIIVYPSHKLMIKGWEMATSKQEKVK